MELESVSLKLPRDLLSGAQRVATARDVTVGHLVRQLLKKEVDRQLIEGKSGRTEPRLLAALKVLVSKDISEADNWDDLAQRLRPHGYHVRSAEGEFLLYKSSCGTFVCTIAELGFKYASLNNRLGPTTPDHYLTVTREAVMPAGAIDATRHATVSAHMDSARSWPDLINRLAGEGMELRLLGVGLGVFVTATGRHLCNSDTVGPAYQTLVDRYGADLPVRP